MRWKSPTGINGLKAKKHTKKCCYSIFAYVQCLYRLSMEMLDTSMCTVNFLNFEHFIPYSFSLNFAFYAAVSLNI